MRFKCIIVLILLTSNFSLTAQSTTYSKYEEDFVRYLNNKWGYSVKYSSYDSLGYVIDSCNKFLEQFPNSFAKANVYYYLLELHSLTNSDLEIVDAIADTVFYYDSSISQQLRYAIILIDRYSEFERGNEILKRLIPQIENHRKKQMALGYLAWSEFGLGNYSNAKFEFEKAISVDTTNIYSWYDYLTYFQLTEKINEQNYVKDKIASIESKNIIEYKFQATQSPNVAKNISEIRLVDLEGNEVLLSTLLTDLNMITFYNFFCGFCKKALTSTKPLIKKNEKVNFIYINTGESREELYQRYFNKPEYSFLTNRTYFVKLNKQNPEIIVRAVPKVFIVNSEGFIIGDYHGYNQGMEKVLQAEINRDL